MTTCSVRSCDRSVNARGLCKRHYYRWSRYGDPLGTPPARPPRPRKVKPPCSIEGCDRQQYGRGWCENHYARWRRTGTTDDTRAASRDPLERFWEKVDKDGPISAVRPDLGACWLWTGSPNGSGYGSFNLGGRVLGSHVAVLVLTGETIPVGHEPDHLCHVRLCVRRDHLEVVTAAENKRRANLIRWPAKT